VQDIGFKVHGIGYKEEEEKMRMGERVKGSSTSTNQLSS
jgi:hypothetical protein